MFVVIGDRPIVTTYETGGAEEDEPRTATPVLSQRHNVKQVDVVVAVKQT